MKHLILIAALLTSTSAWADDKVSNDQLCAGWGGLAAKIMELRQNEVPMSRVMEIAAGNSDDTRERNVVIAAYNEPAYGSDTAKQKAIDAFRNKIEHECYKSVK